jgi:16S rRNA (guanine527-N7)-methyltransferase
VTDPVPLTPGEFRALTNVSRETLACFQTYLDLLQKWQKALNLVAKSTLKDPWRRHILDSAQLAPLIPRRPCRVLDLGSGAGFPGLVLSLLEVGEIHLVESDGRKCVFLREAIRITESSAILHEGRAESLPSIGADVVTARALASVEDLLGYAARHLKQDGVCLFLKGKGAEDELTQAGKGWKMRVERFPSRTDPGGCILLLGEIRRVRPQE